MTISVGFYIFHLSTFSEVLVKENCRKLWHLEPASCWRKGARPKATQQQECALACSFLPAATRSSLCFVFQTIGP